LIGLEKNQYVIQQYKQIFQENENQQLFSFGISNARANTIASSS